MTLIALTDCCRLLAVDRKTLHRWLAQAELSLQTHPRDARSKGLSREHLLHLARAHHRSLADLPAEPAAPPALLTVPASPELEASLLPLLHTLGALPQQIAALQQHLAQLTALLQSLPWPTVTTVPPEPRSRPGKPRPATKGTAPQAPASSAPRPVPPVHVVPRVE